MTDDVFDLFPDEPRVERLHFSRLRLMARSPAHYRAAARTETRAMRGGIASHVAALGGQVIVYPGERRGLAWEGFRRVMGGAEPYIYDGPRTGKAWAAAKEEAGHRPILTSDEAPAALAARAMQEARRARGEYPAAVVTPTEYEEAQRIADAVHAHGTARDLIEHAKRETYHEWTFAGRDCAGTMDLRGRDYVCELKRTRCSEPGRFARDALWRAYHAQLVWYGHSFDTASTPWAPSLFIIAVESEAPHVVTVFELDETAIAQGEQMLRGWLERLAVCEASDEWPGYVQSTVPLRVETDFELVGFDDEEADDAA